MKQIIFAIAMLLGFVQGVQATAYKYYIAQRDGTTMYFRGTNTKPTSSWYSEVTNTGGQPSWAGGSVWPTITKVVFEPSFAEARPKSTAQWFARFSSLTNIEGMQEYLNTSEVTQMQSMFNSCSNLTMLDLTGFNTANVTQMQNMFKGCSKLKTIVVGDGWTTEKARGSYSNFDMFKDCTSLVGQDGTTYNSKQVDRGNAHYGEGGYLTSEATYWQGRVADSFAVVDGTTITIHNLGEMRLLARKVNSGTTYSGTIFLLAKDLNFGGIENDYAVIGSSDTKCFSGTFDGQGHTVRGISLRADSRQALFGTVKGGTVKNLTIDNSTIVNTNNSMAAGIVARMPNGGTIENCHVTSTVTITSEGYAGGIVGYTYVGSVSITGCTSAASVSTTGNGYAAGGIVGFCGYTGTILNDASTVTIADCLYYGASVSGTGNHLGGIIGNCYENTNGYSAINLSNNFYTYPDASVKGIGHKDYKVGENTTKMSNIDVAASHGAVCARVVTSEADIADMGTQNGATNTAGVAVYENGIAYGSKYYSHVLALPDDEDNTALISQYNGQTFDVKLRGRILYKNGSWNTLGLPFAVNSFEGTIFENATECEVRELDLGRYQIKDKIGVGYNDYHTGVQDGKLYLFFKKVISIAAGRPYLVKWKKVSDYNENDPAKYDHLSPTFRGVTINNSAPDENLVESSDGKVSFQSTYAPVSYDRADPSTLYLGAYNGLYYPNGAGTVTIGPFRAYFQLGDGVQMAASGSSSEGDSFVPVGGGDARAITINVVNSQATGINEWPTLDPALGSLQGGNPIKWHTLDGQTFPGQPTRSGLFIVDGKTVVVKP